MMRPFHALAAAAALVAVACSSSTPKPADGPEQTPPADASATPAASAAPTAGPDAPPPPETTPVKRDDANAIPDDYQLTQHDCNELGKVYHDVSKGDLMKGLSAKLTEKQRTATEANIDKEVTRVSAQWTDTCQSNLVGKSVDQKAIKCALAAATVKAFDVCLNGPEGTKQPAGKAPAKKKK